MATFCYAIVISRWLSHWVEILDESRSRDKVPSHEAPRPRPGEGIEPRTNILKSFPILAASTPVKPHPVCNFHSWSGLRCFRFNSMTQRLPLQQFHYRKGRQSNARWTRSGIGLLVQSSCTCFLGLFCHVMLSHHRSTDRACMPQARIGSRVIGNDRCKRAQATYPAEFFLIQFHYRQANQCSSNSIEALGREWRGPLARYTYRSPTLNPTWACCMLFFRSYGDATDLKNSPRKESA